jgi:hypothetical protein
VENEIKETTINLRIKNEAIFLLYFFNAFSIANNFNNNPYFLKHCAKKIVFDFGKKKSVCFLNKIHFDDR